MNFGSTTTTIIRKSVFPVFVIPEKAEYKPIENITCFRLCRNKYG
jgi:hypothetical protein